MLPEIGNRLRKVDNCGGFPASAKPRRRTRQVPSEPATAVLAPEEEDPMAHTNRSRVILGGLLAGLVINIVEFITNGVVLREAWGRAVQALGKPTELSTGAIVIFNIWGFLLGLAAVC